MRFGSSNNLLLFVLQTMLVSIVLMLTNVACAQDEAARIKESRQHEAKALELRLKKDFRGALQEQLKAVELNPKDSKPLTILAGIYEEINENEKAPENLQKAKDVLEKAVELDSNDAVAHEMLGDVSDLTGNKEQALAKFKEAARLEPKNLRYLTNVAVMQNELNQIEEVRQTLRTVLAKDPNYIYALYQFGFVEEQEKNFVQAKEYYQTALKAQPKERDDAYFQEEAKKRLDNLNEKK